ncbi:MAG: peptide chain release factor N(5)-glutamine methyltransferase [Bacteroidales bacterium]|nr:peptide chain release factor N(5)-glutamine methyltransferase [Bacteroidales bacterium]
MKYSAFNIFLKNKLNGLYSDRETESVSRLILEHLTGLSWIQVRLNWELDFTQDQEKRAVEIVQRLQDHEPIQYVLGETEFYGLTFKVRPGVLIPRGETEELVEWVIEASRFRGNDREDKVRMKGLRVLDIGCGSGAIAIALAKNMPDAAVFAADISEEALQVARENAALNNQHITLINFDILLHPSTCHPREGGDLVPNNEGYNFDLIVSNPPYIPFGDKMSMDLHVVDYEPEIALFVPDNDPLLFYRAIAGFAAEHLNPGGEVFVEIHERLGDETADVFRKRFSNVELRKDIHGKDRMIRAHHG